MAKKKRKYGSAAARAKAAAAVAGPGGGGGTMFKNIPSDMEFFNPEAKKYTLRLLPYVVSDTKHPDGEQAPAGEIWYKRPFKRFRQIGIDKKPFISPRSIGKPCPISEYYIQAKSNPDIPDSEANKAKPQDCVLYNVQVIDKKGKPGPIMLWWFSYHLFEKQLKKELLDPDNEEFLGFMDLEGGTDLRVRFEKESFAGSDFVCADNITFVEREDLDESILDEVADLDNVLVIKEYDELRAIFLEIDDDTTAGNSDPNDDDEPEPPKKKRGKKTAKPEPEPDPEPKENELTADDLVKADNWNKLVRLIKKNDIDVDPDDYDDDHNDLREAIAEELDIELPEEEEPQPDCFGDDFNPKAKGCKKCQFKIDCENEAKPEPKEEEEEEEPKPKKSGKKSSKKDKKDGGCPYGHKWAVDCDEKEECDDCKKWEECSDAQDELADD